MTGPPDLGLDIRQTTSSIKNLLQNPNIKRSGKQIKDLRVGSRNVVSLTEITTNAVGPACEASSGYNLKDLGTD